MENSGLIALWTMFLGVVSEQDSRMVIALMYSVQFTMTSEHTVDQCSEQRSRVIVEM